MFLVSSQLQMAFAQPKLASAQIQLASTLAFVPTLASQLIVAESRPLRSTIGRR